MLIVYVLLGLNCLFSSLNLVAILFLSNSLFRVLVPKESEPESARASTTSERGLVDPKAVPTYDPRFRT